MPGSAPAGTSAIVRRSETAPRTVTVGAHREALRAGVEVERADLALLVGAPIVSGRGNGAGERLAAGGEDELVPGRAGGAGVVEVDVELAGRVDVERPCGLVASAPLQ